MPLNTPKPNNLHMYDSYGKAKNIVYQEALLLFTLISFWYWSFINIIAISAVIPLQTMIK